MGDLAYHLREMEIAKSRDDHRNCTPVVSPDAVRILDIGCGAGQTLLTMDASPTAHRVGVDLDFDALRLGKSLEKNISFAKARGESLPFKAGYFDAVIARVSLPYMNIPAAFSEMHRVLRPGGELWLSLHPFRMILRELLGSMIPPKPKAITFRSFIILNGVVSALSGRQMAFPFGSRSCETFQTERGIRKLLRRSGFEVLSVKKRPHFIVTARKITPSSLPQPGIQA